MEPKHHCFSKLISRTTDISAKRSQDNNTGSRILIEIFYIMVLKNAKLFFLVYSEN